MFSSTSGHGEGDAGAIAGAPAAEPTFPWRGAPSLIAQPEGMLTKMFLAMFAELDLSGEDLKVKHQWCCVLCPSPQRTTTSSLSVAVDTPVYLLYKYFVSAFL